MSNDNQHRYSMASRALLNPLYHFHFINLFIHKIVLDNVWINTIGVIGKGVGRKRNSDKRIIKQLLYIEGRYKYPKLIVLFKYKSKHPITSLSDLAWNFFV